MVIWAFVTAMKKLNNIALKQDFVSVFKSLKPALAGPLVDESPFRHLFTAQGGFNPMKTVAGQSSSHHQLLERFQVFFSCLPVSTCRLGVDLHYITLPLHNEDDPSIT